ncbi:MAG: polyisoprenoid-binding protein [Chlorobiaceae bacterium]|nr:polyisoprenoid-binding protein [Chlorobiaceae bacterium]
MKKTCCTIACAFALLFPKPASASTWTIDPDHSNVGFSIRHLTITNVKGDFLKFNGTVELDDRNVTRSTVEATIDPASISTNVQKRDDHLRGPDFFDVAKYPGMNFVSKKWSTAGKGELRITGDLTIHGITKEVVLHAEPFTREVKDPWGNIRRSTSATAKINRRDFGLGWNQTLESGGAMIGDEVTIDLEIEMVRKLPK